MRKLFLAAAAAVCLMGAAQAVMVDWRGSYTSTGAYGDGLDGAAKIAIQDGTVSPGSGWYVLTVAFTLDSSYTKPNGWPAIVSLTHSNQGEGNYNGNLRLSLNDDGKLSLNGDGSAAVNPPTVTDSALETGKSYTVSLAIGQNAEGQAVASVTLYSEGTLIGSLTDYVLNTAYADAAWDTIVLGSGSVTDSSGNRTFGEGQLTVTQVTLLPEPTALALLALGVAGIALRRRVA